MPGISANGVALANVVRELGWRRLSILHVDSAWGKSFAFSFSNVLDVLNVDVLTTRSFTNADPASISTAVKDLRRSGARIFIYIDVQSSGNVGFVLNATREHRMAGGEYTWVAWEEARDPENLLEIAQKKTGTPSQYLRAQLLGWINIGVHADVAAREKLVKALDAVAARAPVAAPHLLYHPVLCPPHQGGDDGGGDAGVGNGVRDEPSPGDRGCPAALHASGEAFLTVYAAFAYDCVWALALGLALAARSTGEAKDASYFVRQANFTGPGGGAGECVRVYSKPRRVTKKT